METNRPRTVSYTASANNLITYVSELLEHLHGGRSVSSVSTGGGDQDGAYKSDGNVNTRYITNWRSVLSLDTKNFIAERNNQGVN